LLLRNARFEFYDKPSSGSYHKLVHVKTPCVEAKFHPFGPTAAE
jgi:hypothetical protein